MDWLATHEMMVIGLIFMLVIGPAVGNYACSVVYRLPRGKTPFERHPFCGHCNADLKPKDLFPILSWVLTKGKCRYCAGPIPGIYTVIEVLCGAIFIGYFLHFGISEAFVLYTLYAVFVVILASIEWQQGWLSSTIYSYALGTVAIARTLQDHTIYGFVKCGFTMLIIMLVLMKLFDRRAQAFAKNWVWWFTLMGALLPMALWKYVAVLFVLKFLIPKPARVILYTTGALMLPLVAT